jgi:hypothetical protein
MSSSTLGIMNPIDNPETWDSVQIGGTTSPGVCHVGEWKRHHDFDIKKGKGAQGATITFVQKPPAEGSIEFELWTADHFNAWDLFLPLLKYDPTKKDIQAIDLYHPSLDAIDVHSVVCTKIGNVVHKGEQLYSITVDFLEYFPVAPKNASSTPNTSSTGNGTGKPGLNEQFKKPKNASDTSAEELLKLLQQAESPPPQAGS